MFLGTSKFAHEKNQSRLTATFGWTSFHVSFALTEQLRDELSKLGLGTMAN